jgi:hypothetical protein
LTLAQEADMSRTPTVPIHRFSEQEAQSVLDGMTFAEYRITMNVTPANALDALNKMPTGFLSQGDAVERKLSARLVTILAAIATFHGSTRPSKTWESVK